MHKLTSFYAPISGSVLETRPLLRFSEMQSTLFAESTAANGFRDPSFTKNKHLPLHRWVPWVAGFSAGFVQDCLVRYLPNPTSESWVLDPFTGVGTTLVESYLAGLNVVGFEINPYAALATNIKLSSMQVSVCALSKEIAAFERFMKRAEGSGRRMPLAEPPKGFTGRTQLFSPKVERKVLYALDFIGGIDDPMLKTIFRLVPASTNVIFNNYSYKPTL